MTVLKNPVAVRLGKLADAGKTGVLSLSGESGGAIHLEKGEIAYAECRVTPSLRTRIERAEELAGHKLVGSFERTWMAREATADAATELLSVKPRYVRFRESDNPAADASADGMPVGELITEVSRRHELLGQMSAVLAPDTPVVRNPRLKSRVIHVSDIQWAILMRLDDPAPARTIAQGLGQSVFSATIEVFRMVAMDLVSLAGSPATPDEPAGEPGSRRPAICFIRALAG
jgi:Domain of unknown function (DUF4388)